MAKTSEDIERLLNAIESRQVRCPECDSTDATILFPRYDVAYVRFEIDGTIVHGDSDCSEVHPDLPTLLVCCKCQTRWPVAGDAKIEYDYKTECECAAAAQKQRDDDIRNLSASGEARCHPCNEPVRYDEDTTASATQGRLCGKWVHEANGSNVCDTTKTAGGRPQYAYVRT